MARFTSTVREYPGRWIGFQLPWKGNENRLFNEYVKTLPMRSFDMNTKTWWVPSIYAMLALTAARDHGLVTGPQFDKGREMIARDVVHPDVAFVSAFKALHLLPTAPFWLVEKTYTEWKIRLNSINAFDEIAVIDNAYNVIKAACSKSTEALVTLAADALRAANENDGGPF